MYAIKIGQKLLLIPIQFHPGATLVNLIDTHSDLANGGAFNTNRITLNILFHVL